MTFLLVGLIGLPIFLLLVGRLREGAFSAGWELLLTPRGAELYDEMKEHLDSDLELYDATHARASRLRELGSVDEAMRLARAGCDLIEQATPDRVKQLVAMAVLARMVIAIAPVRPLDPRAFRVRSLVRIIGTAWALHHFLVGTAERLRLRLFVLRLGFQIVAHQLQRSADHLHPDARDVAALWERIELLRADYGTLSEETLSSFRTIIVSVAAPAKKALAVQHS